MRSHSYFSVHLRYSQMIVVGFLLTAWMCPQTLSQEQLDRKNAPTRVAYTGRLFGYYRIEPPSGANTNEVRQGSDNQLLRNVDSFLTWHANWHKRYPDGLLLGMGDNFGPEFGAAIQLDSPGCAPQNAGQSIAISKAESSYPQLLYKSEERLPLRAGCDNVLRFLMKAGYRAIVPGREDFMYSALWLRKVALDLGDQSSSNGEISNINNSDGALQLLAANLRVTGSVEDAKGKPDHSCPLLFAKEPFGQQAMTCNGNVPASEDWLERLDRVQFENTRKAIGEALRLGPSIQITNDLRATVVSNQRRILLAAWGPRCPNLKNLKDSDLSPEGVDCITADRVARSGDDVKDLRTYSKELYRINREFTGQSPMTEQYLLISTEAAQAAQRALLRTIADEQENIGFTIVQKHILIIGIVGQSTMAPASSNNMKICSGLANSDRRDFVSCDKHEKQPGQVNVLDPVGPVLAVLRAARFVNGRFARVIVMAQMPAPEAQEFGARVRTYLQRRPKGMPDNMLGQRVDLILSEAQAEHETASLHLNYDPVHMTPVLTAFSPDPASPLSQMFGAAHEAVLSPTDDFLTSMQIEDRIVYPAGSIQSSHSALALLEQELNDNKGSNEATILAILENLQRKESPADVVLLQRRDFYLDNLPKDFDTYSDEYCPDPNTRKRCQLTVALDRVLWKGDYIERVAITGADLRTVIKKNMELFQGAGAFEINDVSQRWLVSYGITQPPPENLSFLSNGVDPLWVAPDSECRDVKQETTPISVYCVNGKPIADDQIYWVVTTDQLAQDQNLYASLGSLADINRRTSKKFLTEVIASEPPPVPKPSGPPLAAIQLANSAFEQGRLFQVDFSKLIVSFTSTHPLGGDDVVPTAFQGVADARAAVPHSQDLDMEASLRVTWDHGFDQSISLGTMTSMVYERSVKGGLTGSPETITYAQNNASIGGFAQFTLRDWKAKSRALPRSLLVLSPHQYQTQVNNNRLFVPFTTTGANGQLAIPVPIVTGFSDKVGYRGEWGNRPETNIWNLDAGSYAEGGFEFSIQNNILRSVTLANGAVQLTCTATAALDIGTCFKKAAKSTPPFFIDSGTVLAGGPEVSTLHTPGAYWDVHLQRQFPQKIKAASSSFSLVMESQGDVFFGRPSSAVLPTQTNYAIVWNTALTFPVWGNLSFAPTYNVFFYRPQATALHEQLRSVSLALRWYFARDMRVPIKRQLLLSGPASADQTQPAGQSKSSGQPKKAGK